MEQDQVITRLHEIAAEMAESATAGDAPPAGTYSAETDDLLRDDLLRRFGFTSIEALEYLLAVEEEFGITFEDEDLSEELLTSTRHLADRVVRQLASQAT